jgi:hypothetical protein
MFIKYFSSCKTLVYKLILTNALREDDTWGKTKSLAKADYSRCQYLVVGVLGRCWEMADVAFSEQRILTSEIGIKTIRLSNLLPYKQARHQFYAVNSLGSNNYISRQNTSRTWAEFSPLY